MMLLKGKKVNKTLRIYPVYHLPHLTVRLLSLGTFLQQGLSIYRNTSRISLLTNSKLEVLQCIPHKPDDTIYCSKGTSACLQSIHSVFVEDYKIMHRQLGHPSKDILSYARDKTTGFPKGISFPKADPICPGCAKGKMPSKSFPTSESHATKPFEKIHSDLKSFSVVSYHKHKYYISFVDDYSSYFWIVCLCAKSSAIATLKHFLAMVKNQFNTTIKEWMSDAGGEYKSNEFLNALKDNGIKVLQSTPHTPQQNGRAEQFNCTCMDKAQAMHLEACLLDSWWEFTVEHAVHCYNWTLVQHLNWCTPIELLNKKAPSISHLQVFGCGAYVYLPQDMQKDKLAPKSELIVYLGIAEGIKGHHFMHTANNQLFTAATALFDENLFPKCKTSAPKPIT